MVRSAKSVRAGSALAARSRAWMEIVSAGKARPMLKRARRLTRSRMKAGLECIVMFWNWS